MPYIKPEDREVIFDPLIEKIIPEIECPRVFYWALRVMLNVLCDIETVDLILDEFKFAADLASKIRCPGDFNYIVSRIYTLKVVEQGVSYHNLSIWRKSIDKLYRSARQFHGDDYEQALKDASDEIYRKIFILYEDKAVEKNGECFNELLEAIKNIGE